MLEPGRNAQMNGKTKSGETWTTFDTNQDLWFSKAGAVFGSKTALFCLSVSNLCIDVLSQDVSKTPLNLKRRDGKGGSKIVQPGEHKVARLLDAGPNDYMGVQEFIRQTTAHLAVSSEYFIPVRRDRKNEVIEFAGVPKSQTSVTVHAQKRKWFYDITPSTNHEVALYGWAGEKLLDHKSCAHIRKRSMNGLNVLSTQNLTESVRSVLENMQSFQDTTFENGGIPHFAVQFPEGLTDVQFERLKKDLDESIEKSRNTGKPLIFEGAGGKVPEIEKLTMTSADADFTKSYINAGMDMARYFRVPPHKIYLMESIKYDNMEAAERTYVDDALCPYFTAIADGLGRVLLTDKEREEYFLEFDVDKAYAQNPEEKHKIARERWISGMSTHDEMRTETGRNPVGGNAGKVRMMSGNFVLVDDKNNVLMRAGGNKPEDEDPKDKGEGNDKKSAIPRLSVI